MRNVINERHAYVLLLLLLSFFLNTVEYIEREGERERQRERERERQREREREREVLDSVIRRSLESVLAPIIN